MTNDDRRMERISSNRDQMKSTFIAIMAILLQQRSGH